MSHMAKLMLLGHAQSRTARVLVHRQAVKAAARHEMSKGMKSKRFLK